MDKLGAGVGPDAVAAIDVFKVSSEAAAKGMGSVVAEAGKVLVNSLGGTLQAARGPDEEAVVTGPSEATEVVVNPETLLVVGGSAEEAVATADFEARGVMSESLPKTKEVARQAVMTGSEEEALLDFPLLDSDRYDLEDFLLDDTDHATASSDVVLSDDFMDLWNSCANNDIPEKNSLDKAAQEIAQGRIVPQCINDLTSNPNESEIMEQGVTVSVPADLVHHPTEPLIREQGDATYETPDLVHHPTETLIREHGDATYETADPAPDADETETHVEEVITRTVSEPMQQEPQSGLRVETMSNTTTHSTHVDDIHPGSSAPQGGANTNSSTVRSKFVLPQGLQGDSVLANVLGHGFANVTELSESINNNDGRLTKKQALALLHNGEMFQIAPAIQSAELNLGQGGVMTIAGNHLQDYPITSEYHMAGKILKERVPIQLHISGVTIQRYEIKGNRWSRFRYTIDDSYHVLEWPALMIQNEVQVAPRRAATRRITNADVIASNASLVSAINRAVAAMDNSINKFTASNARAAAAMDNSINNFTASSASAAAAMDNSINNFTASSASAVAATNDLSALAAELLEHCKGLLDRHEASSQ